MSKLKLTIFLLMFLPNIASAANNPTVRRVIEEENGNTFVPRIIDKTGQSNVIYGLAAVLLAIIAIFAFNYLMQTPPQKPKRHDRKL